MHAIWLKLAQLGCGAWVERVPTEENIADLPSRLVTVWLRCLCFGLLRGLLREEYRLLLQMGAGRVEAVLDPMFREPQTWEALSVLGVFDSATPGSS